MKYLRWWFWFGLDILACLGLAVVVGTIFGLTAFVEDVKFSWRRSIPP